MDVSRTVNGGIEKVDANIDGNSSETQNEETILTTEYPTRFKLIMTVVALVLSMFLVSILGLREYLQERGRGPLTSLGFTRHGTLRTQRRARSISNEQQ